MKLSEARHIHCIGIKGAGMTALSEVLVSMGIRITGSDVEEVFFTDEVLQRAGISVMEGFAPENIPHDVDMIVYSTAYSPQSNSELRAAQTMSVPVVSYPEAVGELMKEKMGISVCGTHGKTTTSALLAEVLRELGEDPLAIIGSKILQWGGNALTGKGKYLVLEADEYQNKLQHYSPFGVIVTSIDWDHPDFFPDFASYAAVFREMVEKIPHHGVLVSCGDSTNVVKVVEYAHCQKIKYGFTKGNDILITRYEPTKEIERSPFKQSFALSFKGTDLGQFSLRLAGKHNALNAAAVIALCLFLKMDLEKIRSGLSNFTGTSRRFEYIGDYHGALLYDDYAHHPEEIKVTLAAFRELFPSKRIVAVFHPHTYTRTKALLRDFSQSFDDADQVMVLDIYGSAREKQGGVSSAELVAGINTYHRGRAISGGSVTETLSTLRESIGENDVLVTLGAGNVWEITHNLAH